MTLDELEAMSEAAAEEARDYTQRLDDLSIGSSEDDIVVCNMCHCLNLRGYPCWTCEERGLS